MGSGHVQDKFETGSGVWDRFRDEFGTHLVGTTATITAPQKNMGDLVTGGGSLSGNFQYGHLTLYPGIAIHTEISL